MEGVVWAGAALVVWWGWRWAMGRLEALAEADWGARWLNRLDGLNRVFCRRYHRLRGDVLPLPARGPAVVAANHLSGLDPLLLIASARRPLRFLIAREQYQRFGLQWLFRAVGCIPVDRSHRPEAALREALRALRAGEVVAIFPQGRIHVPGRDVAPRIKPGAVRLAEHAACPLLPARVDGVRGRGLVVAAVLIPGRTRVTVYPPLDCRAVGTEACLQRLECILNAPSAAQVPAQCREGARPSTPP